MTSATKKFIGSRIRAHRKSKGVSQAVLAEMMDCEISTISRYENGGGVPDSEQLLKLAKYFGVSPMDFLPVEEDAKRQRIRELQSKLVGLVYKIEDADILENLINAVQIIYQKK
ncbi:helix-turn-helix domain-containing protein [Pseudomonas sp. NPDC098747]|uniref:helix-turn-helix domain-containing protein n=1 Tax=Pseudomonas sp. NPDC098747 TaxID=3364487 RepID=UPI00383B4D75